MLQISAEMTGWARRSKNWSEEQQELRFELGVLLFLGERKSRGGRDKWEARWGPLTPGGHAPYVGDGVAAPPGVSQVPLCPTFDIKIYKEFSRIFWETLFSRIFQKLAYR
jgi:hypothetical protein